MNITLQILVAPATHNIPDPAKNARRYTVGDVVCVWDADVVAPYNGTSHILRDVISSPKFVFVHVRDIPAQINLERAREKLCSDDSVFGTFDGEITVLEYHRRKRFAAALSDIPANVRNRLQSDRQITVTWTQVKNYIKNLRANTQLSDADLA
ncbi:MAG: hypothetical protein ACYCZR_07040 [Burkholderiales bacterium]